MADPIDVGPPPAPLISGKSSKGLAAVILLLAGTAAGGLAWLHLSDRGFDVPALASTFGSGAAAPPVASDNALVAAADFQAFQQQTSEGLQSATQLLAAQQSQLQRLSDDVSGLSAKIDQLQVAVTAPRPAQQTTGTIAAPRKKLAVPKPAGAISVGGAPLTAPAQSAR